MHYSYMNEMKELALSNVHLLKGPLEDLSGEWIIDHPYTHINHLC